MKKLLILALTVMSAGAFAAYVPVFDAVTSAAGTIYSFTPAAGQHCALEGQAALLAAGTTSISGMDFDMVSSAATTFTDLQLQVSFFGAYTGGFSAASPTFTSLLGTVNIDLGAATLAASTYYVFGPTGGTPAVTFAPINLTQTGKVAVEYLWRGDLGTGQGLVYTDAVQMGLNLTAAPTIGSNPSSFQVLYYDKTPSQSTPSSSAISLNENEYLYFGGSPSVNEDFATRFYTTPVPEPASMAVLGLGAMALIRRRRSKKA
jgi:hypothetical protein